MKISVAPEKPGPPCPKCGTGMVIRTSSRGEFWGCPRFPSCRGTRNIEAGEGSGVPLSDWRTACHCILDVLWKEQGMPRDQAYHLGARIMGHDLSRFHFSEMNEEECRRFIQKWAGEKSAWSVKKPGKKSSNKTNHELVDEFLKRNREGC